MQIGNDHILEVLDLGSLPSGERYMVLEYLDGETLADRMKRFIRLTPEQLVPLWGLAGVSLSMGVLAMLLETWRFAAGIEATGIADVEVALGERATQLRQTVTGFSERTA